jgi:phosphatidylserine decarboxylase
MENIIKTSIMAQKYLPNFVTEKFTLNVCSIMGKSRNKADKLRFARTYKIKWKEADLCRDSKNLDECLDRFPTLNHLFSRKIRKDLTKPERSGKKDILSPAECYGRKVSAGGEFEIKGAYYTMQKLLKRVEVPLKSTVFIFRLAPEQYHRFHSPTTSIVKNIRSHGGTYKSVNPLLLDSLPVLQENYRKVIDFENGLIMVTVGASCVGSVNLSIKKGDLVKHGDDIGTFEFGGSCIVLIVPFKIKSTYVKLSEDEQLIKPCLLLCNYS